MDVETPFDIDDTSHEILTPERQILPLAFASPHSGANYRPEFIAASRLDRLALRGPRRPVPGQSDGGR